MKPVLIVDDDPQMRIALNEAIQRMGYDTTICENGLNALDKLRNANYSMVVTDMNMPKMDGLSLLKEIRSKIGNLPVLVITGFGTVDNAVQSMKEGAADYLQKPFSFDSLKEMIDSVIKRTYIEKEILTVDPEMKKIITLAGNLAASDITVLIHGESGTGKELLARYIHKFSKRSEKPFIAVNCAAIPDNLLESELFGYEKGAFTGAIDRKKGKFELANGGTILLDEIGEMSMTLQAKLLRVLQEKEVDRIGGREPINIDVRVIATTNRDLKKECAESRFREDLFYRLSVFPLKVPPLRERPDDIVFLSMHFMKKYSGLAGKKINGFSEDALDLIKRKQWNGNVRELENTIQRAVFLCDGETIKCEHFMFDDYEKMQVQAGSIKEMEKELIIQTLKEAGGNKTKAAKKLGVSVRTIRNKLNEYKIQEHP
ncbi:MAG: sigma-54-dependent Fis family transcriptional regulator [Nitrospirae bacterium]|jgi:two-component system response regulator FlrC|nr:sigma-54-dependent Fis family transcriptional regulator [Nitrospirota bacterium]